MSTLLRAFDGAVSTARAAARSSVDTEELTRALGALYNHGKEAHPGLRVSEEAFGRRVARCVDNESPDALERLVAADLYLACACVEGARGAAAAFELQCGKVIRRAVSRMFAGRDDRDEAEQRVRQHLLVRAGEAGPALAKYPGQVPLAKWLPVVAIRIAISLKRSESTERRLREKAGAEALGVSPEHLFMKAELRQALEPAVAEALQRLGSRDRLILRLFLVGGMTTHAIGKSLGLSHQAVSKRLAKARETVVDDVREVVSARLKISKDELSSVMRFVVSQLDVSISRVLDER